MLVRVKRCGCCDTLYRRDAFDGHVREPDGLQPFCRACDWDAKRKPHRRYKSLCRSAAKRPRPLRVEITEAEYLAIIQRGECHWCHWHNVFEWDGGLLDRLDVHGHYTPPNVVLCCAPCNRYRNDLPVDIWKPMIDALVARRGPGPFRQHMAPKRPDVSRFIVPETQMALFG